MKIIFLDIDGVLNCETAFKEGFCKYVEWTNKVKKGYHMSFYPPAKNLLNQLIEETDAKIVISSMWRKSGLEFMQNVWEQEGMLGEIVGITPSLYLKDNSSVPRGCEIKKWLEDKGFRHINWSKEEQQKYVKESGIESYVIIDDDSDMLLQQKDHFVHVLPSPRNKDGFTEKHLKQATKILNNEIS